MKTKLYEKAIDGIRMLLNVSIPNVCDLSVRPAITTNIGVSVAYMSHLAGRL